MTRTYFFNAYNDYVKAIWERTPVNGEIGRLGRGSTEATDRNDSYARRRDMQIFATHVEIGCQSIPRAEVEKIIADFAKLGITK